MKKFYLLAAMAIVAVTAQAQQRLSLSTYNGTNLEKYDGNVCAITVNRHICTGWNTIALPFAMSADQLNAIFGDDCKLERLVGVENENGQLVLCFQECKQNGLEAGVPYILHYSGATGMKKIATTAKVSQHDGALTFAVPSSSMTLTMAGAQQHVDSNGRYGVLARDNEEARFVPALEATSGFYATRCYITLSNGNMQTQLATRHLAAGETTGIDAVARSHEKVEVFDLSGSRIAAGIPASEVNALQPGVYVVKGRKVLVK